MSPGKDRHARNALLRWRFNREVAEQSVGWFGTLLGSILSLFVLFLAYSFLLVAPIFSIWPRWLWLKKKPHKEYRK